MHATHFVARADMCEGVQQIFCPHPCGQGHAFRPKIPPVIIQHNIYRLHRFDDHEQEQQPAKELDDETFWQLLLCVCQKSRLGTNTRYNGSTVAIGPAGAGNVEPYTDNSERRKLFATTSSCLLWVPRAVTG